MCLQQRDREERVLLKYKVLQIYSIFAKELLMRRFRESRELGHKQRMKANKVELRRNDYIDKRLESVRVYKGKARLVSRHITKYYKHYYRAISYI